MNKGSFNAIKLIVAVTALCASEIGGFVGGMFGSGKVTSRTPSIPHRHHNRARIHAPNDGRWHMKFHRSR